MLEQTPFVSYADGILNQDFLANGIIQMCKTVFRAGDKRSGNNKSRYYSYKMLNWYYLGVTPKRSSKLLALC